MERPITARVCNVNLISFSACKNLEINQIFSFLLRFLYVHILYMCVYMYQSGV